MKLNQTYPLMDLLDALTAASDNTRELAKQLKAEGAPHDSVHRV